MAEQKDTFESLIDKMKGIEASTHYVAAQYRLQGMKLMTESIDRFNISSGILSGAMILIAVLQTVILLWQIFKWW